LITKQTITSLEEMLPADDFMRVHRSFIVALNKISSYSPQAIFIGKDEIPVGPLFKSELTKKLSVIH
jgi:DNA-binding LytR/AlgR family response regulator